MRGAHGVAAHLLQHADAEGLQPVRQRRADSGVILVVAGALNLHRLPVEQEAVVGVELDGAYAKRDALGVADLVAGLDGHDGCVEVGGVDGPEGRIYELGRCCKSRAPVNANWLRGRFGSSHGLAIRIQDLPVYFCTLRLLSFVLHHRFERQNRSRTQSELSGTGGQLRTHDALPRPQVQRIGFSEPYVPVNSGALVEPPIAIASVHARHNAVLRADGEKVGNVEAEGRVAVVVAPDEAPVHKHHHIAKGAVKLDRNAPPGVARGNVELAPVPPHAGLGIAPPQRLESMRRKRVVPHKGQLHRPVVGQVQQAPFRVVVSHPGKLEIAGLGEAFLIVSETEIPSRIDAIAELESPAEVEEQLLARGKGGCGGSLRGTRQESGGARPS